jgi:hypothetical protein
LRSVKQESFVKMVNMKNLKRFSRKDAKKLIFGVSTIRLVQLLKSMASTSIGISKSYIPEKRTLFFRVKRIRYVHSFL